MDGEWSNLMASFDFVIADNKLVQVFTGPQGSIAYPESGVGGFRCGEPIQLR